MERKYSSNRRNSAEPRLADPSTMLAAAENLLKAGVNQLTGIKKQLVELSYKGR